MKSIFYLVLILFTASCQSNTDKAQKLIKDNLYKTLHDFTSYEPIEFSQLDSVYSTIESTGAPQLLKEANALADSAQKLLKASRIFEESRKEYHFCDSMFLVTTRSADSLLEISNRIITKADSISLNFVPIFCGYRMTHRFRAKNSEGNFILTDNEYFIDKNITTALKSN